MFFPEALLTSLVPAVVIVGIYLNQETPLYAKLQKNNEEMVMGFALLERMRFAKYKMFFKTTLHKILLFLQNILSSTYSMHYI